MDIYRSIIIPFVFVMIVALALVMALPANCSLAAAVHSTALESPRPRAFLARAATGSDKEEIPMSKHKKTHAGPAGPASPAKGEKKATKATAAPRALAPLVLEARRGRQVSPVRRQRVRAPFRPPAVHASGPRYVGACKLTPARPLPSMSSSPPLRPSTGSRRARWRLSSSSPTSSSPPASSSAPLQRGTIDAVQSDDDSIASPTEVSVFGLPLQPGCPGALQPVGLGRDLGGRIRQGRRQVALGGCVGSLPLRHQRPDPHP